MKLKFRDDFHEGTEDGFRVENQYRSKHKLVRIFQEFENGIIREFVLTPKDLRQMLEEIAKQDD